MASVLEFMLKLYSPEHARCMGCNDLSGTDTGWLCGTCTKAAERLRIGDRLVCQRCGMPLNLTGRCQRCAEWPSDGVREARYVYIYASPVDMVIRNMKYNSYTRLAEWMGGEIAQMVGKDPRNTYDLIVPVPMHGSRRRWRGWNHAALFADVVSRQLGIPKLEVLKRTRRTKAQATLPWDKRIGALEGAFSVVREIAGQRILLIDDVITTGETVNRCAEALYRAGAADVCAASFAGHGQEYGA